MRVLRQSTVLFAGLIVLAAVVAAGALPQAAAAAPPLNAYRGLGTWVDMYDAAAWNDPVKGGELAVSRIRRAS